MPIDPSKIIYLTDRSAAETDDTCGMRYWLNRLEGPAKKGIVPVNEPLALMIGRESHEDLALIATMPDISEQAISAAVEDILSGLSDEDKQFPRKMEMLYRRLGWFIAWGLYIESQVRVKWRTLQIEHELILDRDPLFVAVTPDRVLESIHHGFKVYWEYKSTISAKKQWMDSWLYQIQLHLGLAAVQEELGEKLKFGQIIGLQKGYTSQSDGRLMHPYAWGYYNAKTGSWTHNYLNAHGMDWSPRPVWDYPGGLIKWVQLCGEDVAKNQFPFTQPVFLNERLLDEWIMRRTAREQQIRVVEPTCRESLRQRSIFFERRLSKCRPAWGDACPYLLACHNAEVAKDPASHPDYVQRIPHHDVELIGELG